MSSVIRRAVFFSAGVFVIWFAPALKAAILPPEGVARVAAVLAGILIVGTITNPSGLGALLGLSAARDAMPFLPMWIVAVTGGGFAFLMEPSFAALRMAGLQVPGKRLGFLLTVLVAAAVLAWLCARSAKLLRGSV